MPKSMMGWVKFGAAVLIVMYAARQIPQLRQFV